MKYIVIGDEDTVLGFGMVGVSGTVVTTAAEAQKALSEAFNDTDAGIIIITERVANLIKPEVDRFIFTRQFPLIVEIPDRLGPMPGRAGVREMIQNAIGIKI